MKTPLIAKGLVSVACLLAALGRSAAQQPPLYLVDTPFDPPTHTSIYAVNPTTGTMTLRADIGATYSPVFALAAASGTLLYAAGTEPSGTCPGAAACLLLRIELDPNSTVPLSVTNIGPFRLGVTTIGEVVGMSFRA